MLDLNPGPYTSQANTYQWARLRGLQGWEGKEPKSPQAALQLDGLYERGKLTTALSQVRF